MFEKKLKYTYININNCIIIHLHAHILFKLHDFNLDI